MQCIILCMALNNDEWSFLFLILKNYWQYVSDVIFEPVRKF